MLKLNHTKHPTEIEHYNGSLHQLANDIGNLRYDALADFLKHLWQKLEDDAKKDLKKGRKQLFKELDNASMVLCRVEHIIWRAWKIAGPHMKR